MTKQNSSTLRTPKQTKKGNRNVESPSNERVRKEHICPECGRPFSRPCFLKDHMSVHTGDKPFKCNFKNCGMSFAKKGNLVAHKHTHTPKRKRPFKCKLCPLTFTIQTALRKHVKRHKEKEKFICRVCKKGFPTNNELKIHMRKHTGARPFKCSWEGCDDAFTTSGNLDQHILQHTGKKPVKCKLCGKRFRRKSELKTHNSFNHNGDKSHKCKFCDQAFVTTGNLNYHTKRNHPNAETTLPSQSVSKMTKRKSRESRSMEVNGILPSTSKKAKRQSTASVEQSIQIVHQESSSSTAPTVPSHNETPSCSSTSKRKTPESSNSNNVIGQTPTREHTNISKSSNSFKLNSLNPKLSRDHLALTTNYTRAKTLNCSSTSQPKATGSNQNKSSVKGLSRYSATTKSNKPTAQSNGPSIVVGHQEPSSSTVQSSKDIEQTATKKRNTQCTLPRRRLFPTKHDTSVQCGSSATKRKPTIESNQQNSYDKGPSRNSIQNNSSKPPAQSNEPSIQTVQQETTHSTVRASSQNNNMNQKRNARRSSSNNPNKDIEKTATRKRDNNSKSSGSDKISTRKSPLHRRRLSPTKHDTSVQSPSGSSATKRKPTIESNQQNLYDKGTSRNSIRNNSSKPSAQSNEPSIQTVQQETTHSTVRASSQNNNMNQKRNARRSSSNNPLCGKTSSGSVRTRSNPLTTTILPVIDGIEQAPAKETTDKFECLLCNKVFTRKFTLTVHNKHFHAARLYECNWPNCGKAFGSKSLFNRHRSVHTGKNRYKCTWKNCIKVFGSSTNLSIHKRTHTGELRFQCSWENCNMRFVSSAGLDKHQRKHLAERPFECEWTGCKKTFKRNHHLKRHFETHTKKSKK